MTHPGFFADDRLEASARTPAEDIARAARYVAREADETVAAMLGLPVPGDCPDGPDCDASEEPCCDGCASGLGPCPGPGYTLVCTVHDTAHQEEALR